MKPLPGTPELLRVARRVVWFKPPEDTLAHPIHFLAQVMTYGTPKHLGFAAPHQGLARPMVAQA